MSLSYTHFISSILRDWYKPSKRLSIKTKVYFDLFNCIKGLLRDIFEKKTYIDMSNCNKSICNANNLTGFYIIQGSFAKGALGTDFGKSSRRSYETFCIRFSRILGNIFENYLWGSLILVQLHMKACNFIKRYFLYKSSQGFCKFY